MENGKLVDLKKFLFLNPGIIKSKIQNSFFPIEISQRLWGSMDSIFKITMISSKELGVPILMQDSVTHCAGVQ